MEEVADGECCPQAEGLLLDLHPSSRDYLSAPSSSSLLTLPHRGVGRESCSPSPEVPATPSYSPLLVALILPKLTVGSGGGRAYKPGSQPRQELNLMQLWECHHPCWDELSKFDFSSPTSPQALRGWNVGWLDLVQATVADAGW